MSPHPPDLNPSEWTLLQALWRLGGGTVREVHGAVARPTGWARTTVKTLLERMAEKGLVRANDATGVRRYLATRRREQVVPRAVGSFLDRVLGDSLEPLVTYIADARGLTAGEVEQLRRLIEKGAKEGSDAGDATEGPR